MFTVGIHCVVFGRQGGFDKGKYMGPAGGAERPTSHANLQCAEQNNVLIQNVTQATLDRRVELKETRLNSVVL